MHLPCLNDYSSYTANAIGDVTRPHILVNESRRHLSEIHWFVLKICACIHPWWFCASWMNHGMPRTRSTRFLFTLLSLECLWSHCLCVHYRIPVGHLETHTLTQGDAISLQWRHNGRDSVSNHQRHDCLLNRLFRRRSQKTSKLRVTGLCAGNSPVPGEYPAQRASNAENVSIWWRHRVSWYILIITDSGNDFLTDGTRSLIKPMLTYHQFSGTNVYHLKALLHNEWYFVVLQDDNLHICKLYVNYRGILPPYLL